MTFRACHSIPIDHDLKRQTPSDTTKDTSMKPPTFADIFGYVITAILVVLFALGAFTMAIDMLIGPFVPSAP